MKIDINKMYQSSLGYQLNIRQMVRAEPEWAAIRIQIGEKAIADRDHWKERCLAAEEHMRHLQYCHDHGVVCIPTTCKTLHDYLTIVNKQEMEAGDE
jgi:hypothetical protein